MPRIRSFDLYHVAVPLKKRIKHASHERSTSDSMVARIRLDDGSEGFGEGVPRDYVTGETIETAFATLGGADLTPLLGDTASPGGFLKRLEDWTLPQNAADPRGMAANAARCALEIALFDAYGRSFGLPISSLLGQVEFAQPILLPRPKGVRYSGAIMAETARKERISAWKMRIYGFHQVKVKVGVAGQDDPARLKLLRKILGRNVDIRIDANEAWSSDELIDRVEPLRDLGITALEQPVPHRQVDDLSDLRPRIAIPIMLDESLCGLPDAERAVERRTADILNVRLSKCGGFLNSLRIMALASRAGLQIQLGCHPGETGLLSAAGRHLASIAKDIRYLEGSYDRHVLSRNLTKTDVSFRYGGRAEPLEGAGLGVEVDPGALEEMTVTHREISL